TSRLPTYSASSQPRKPSRTKDYIEAALAVVESDIASAFHKAREVFGGLVKGDATDVRAPFEAFPALTPKDVDGGLSTECSAKASMAGSSAVFFRPSNVGGDNYVLKAELDVSGGMEHLGDPATI